jgi:hypothetical protein
LDSVTVALIVQLRADLVAEKLDARSDAIVWHLEHHHGTRESRATVHGYLT